MRDIAEVVGRGLKVPVISVSPEEAPAHFGWLAAFAGRDLPASGALTQKRLAWRPTGPGLIADPEQMRTTTFLEDCLRGSRSITEFRRRSDFRKRSLSKIWLWRK